LVERVPEPNKQEHSGKLALLQNERVDRETAATTAKTCKVKSERRNTFGQFAVLPKDFFLPVGTISELPYFLLDKHDSRSILAHKARTRWLTGKAADLYKGSAEKAVASG